MGLKEVLEKMKLVELEQAPDVPAAPSAPRPPAGSPPLPRPSSVPRGAAPPPMADVLKSAPAKAKLDDAAASKVKTGADSMPDFDSVYQAAGVKVPAHGFSAYKVLEFLSSPDLAALDARSKAAALGVSLKMNPSGPVPISDIIQDAVARDQALDGFEEFLRKKLDTRREELEKQSADLQAEIDEVTRRNREKMEANRQALDVEKERLTNWQARKRIEERKLFDAVAPFVEENPVSVGGSQAPATAPPAKPREGA
jgi:hypothetical protein